MIRIGRAEDVPLLEGRSVTVAGRRVAVFRLPEGFVALDAACPHRAGPLSDGIVADSCVTCPLHGWRFDLRTGAPAGGGATGGVTAHEVVERDGELYVRLKSPALREAA
jgi:nitrite reductase [NAD(P)H] small subunit